MRWKLSLSAFAMALVLVLGACETDPATDVTHNAATLNAKGRCYSGMSGWSRFQLRDVTAGGTFAGVGDRYVYNCGGDTGVVQFEPKRIGGLTAGHLYQFRLRTELDNGEQFWTDSVGTRAGTNYDSFRTAVPVIAYESENYWNGDTSDDPGIPNTWDESSVEASLGKHCKGRFKPLQNIKNYWVKVIVPNTILFYYDKLYEAGQLTKWCWYSGPYGYGRIYYRDTKFKTNVTSRLGGVVLDQYIWSSGCNFDKTNCLVRSELHARIGITLPEGLPSLNKNNFHCIGTRIYSGGTHNRNIQDDECSDVVGGSSAAGANRRLEFEGTSAQLSPSMERQLDRACFSAPNLRHYNRAGKVLPTCVRASRRAYESLRR
jgi:hypothetical protein